MIDLRINSSDTIDSASISSTSDSAFIESIIIEFISSASILALNITLEKSGQEYSGNA
jgi:hypothetical protein